MQASCLLSTRSRPPWALSKRRMLARNLHMLQIRIASSVRTTRRKSQAMKTARLFTLLLAAALSLGATIAHAQEWPNHPVKVVVPYGPGGIADVFGRITADRLAKFFGIPFVVESRGGAGGAI